MITLLNTSWAQTSGVLYVYDAGGTKVVLEYLTGLVTPVEGVEPPLSVTQSYIALKTELGATFTEFTSSTLGTVLVNAERVKRINTTDGISVEFDNGRVLALTNTAAEIADAINLATAPPSGGGGLVVTTVEVDLGAISSRGDFDIIDATCLTTSEVNVWQGYLPLTGKGTRADENEMDRLIIYAKPNVGRINVRWEVNPIFLAEKLGYDSYTRNLSSLPISEVLSMISNKRRGLVKGNFKFKYTIQN